MTSEEAMLPSQSGATSGSPRRVALSQLTPPWGPRTKALARAGASMRTRGGEAHVCGACDAAAVSLAAGAALGPDPRVDEDVAAAVEALRDGALGAVARLDLLGADAPRRAVAASAHRNIR